MDVQDSSKRTMQYSFSGFTLDLGAERLLEGANEIRLRPKSFQVMRYLVEHQGRLVTREELFDAVWGDVAVSEDSITKCIGDIRKALRDDSQKIIRTVPRRGFLFQAECRDVQPSPSPPPHVPAAHENGPEATLAIASVKRRHPITARRTAVIAAAVVFGAVTSLTWLQMRGYLFGRPPAFEAIAVLPFESLSEGADRQYLADGITEALITNLGQASPLRVIARTSVNQYRGTRKPIREIAGELNVDVVVEGTITQAGDRLRVTANLIQVSPERHIWARAYERKLADVLVLQDEVAAGIAVEIHGKTTPRLRPGRSRPVKPEAQLAYATARYFLNALRDQQAIRKSIEYAEQAVRIEPDYASAHATLAISYALLSGGETIPPEAVTRAKSAAERAIALDEELAEAHVALGTVRILYDWDWAGAERELKRAIGLNPSHAEAHQWLANYLAAIGRVDEAVRVSKRARELDPLSFRANWNVGRILCFARKYEEALAELHRAGEMQRNSSLVDVWIVKACLKKGLADEAVAVDVRIRDYRDGFSAKQLDLLRAAYSQNGLRGYWTKLRELLLPKFRSTANGVYRLAEINAYLGDNEEAFRWLERAYQSRTNWMPWMKVDPSLDPLRSDPRFGAILKRMSLTP